MKVLDSLNIIKKNNNRQTRRFIELLHYYELSNANKKKYKEDVNDLLSNIVASRIVENRKNSSLLLYTA